MKKKKIIGIICSVIGGVLVSALLAYGIVRLNTKQTMEKNRVETGNVLGVSWYKEDGEEFSITTAEQLNELARLSNFYNFRNQTIRLDADIVLNEGSAVDFAENAPANKWVPVSGFDGTFDGQGHTVSGLYAKAFADPMAMFVNTTYRCEIKNLRLVNSYIATTGYSGTASFVSGGGGKLSKLYSDAIIECKGENAAGIMSTVNVQTSIDECWYDGSIHITQRDCGGIIDEITKQRVTIKNSLFSGSISSDYTFGGTRTGGLIGRVDLSASVILSDCLVSGKMAVDKTVYTGAFIGSTNTSTEISVNDCYVVTSTYKSIIGESGLKAAFTGQALFMPERELKGVNAYRWTTLDFDGYWAAVDNATPVLKCFTQDSLSLDGVERAFDIDWYKSGVYDFEIANLKQLYGLYFISAKTNFADTNIRLSADITVNRGDASKWDKEDPGNPWFPISDFAGNFDGQGHTISGVYVNTDVNYVGIFSRVIAGGSIKNLSVKNSYFNNYNKTNAFMGSVVGETYGDLDNIYSNAIVRSTGDQVGGIAGRTNDNDSDGKEDAVNVRNCWFDGRLDLLSTGPETEGAVDGGGIVGRLVQGDLNIEHCLNSGTLSSELSATGIHLGGIIGRTVSTGTLNIRDTFNSGRIDSEYTICVGSVIGRITGGDARIVNVTDTFATTESYKSAISSNARSGKLNGAAVTIPRATLTGVGGYQWTSLDFNKYWAAVDKGTPVLKQYAPRSISVAGARRIVDFSWFNQGAKEYAIGTPEKLYGFALLSSCGETFSGKEIKLTADIALDKSIQWVPAGGESSIFAGTFNGQGHTISGMCLDTKSQYGGFFAITSPTSMLKNFRLVDSRFTYSGRTAGSNPLAIIGSVAGDMRGDMENIYSNAVVESCANRAGGLVGIANGAKQNGKYSTVTIKNCWFDGSVSLTGKDARYGGGIASIVMQGNVEFLHCYNSGSVTNEKEDGVQYLGGIVGTEWVANACNVTITDSLNTGKITAKTKNGIGSVIGRIAKTGSKFTFTNVYASSESCVDAKGNVKLMWDPVAKTTVKGKPIAVSEADLLGVGGYKNTFLDFQGYWSARRQGATALVPALKYFLPQNEQVSIAGVIKGDTSWYDNHKDAKEYHIKTPEEFLGIALVFNSGATDFAGKTIYLDNDISLNQVTEGTVDAWISGAQVPDNTWIPIGATYNERFAGIFDGQGHTVSGLYASRDSGDSIYLGLFGVTAKKSVIKNVRIKDSVFKYSGAKNAFIGSVAGEIHGDVSNLYSNADIVTTSIQTGGIIGRVAPDSKEDQNVSIRNCWFDGTVNVTAKKNGAGGIVGIIQRGILTMSNCLNTGTISTLGKDAGGMLGLDNGETSVISIVECMNLGTISGTVKGSILGELTKAKNSCMLVNAWGVEADGIELIGNVSKGTSTYIDSEIVAADKTKGYDGWGLMNDEWVAVSEGAPVPACFKDLVKGEILSTEGKSASDYTWYGNGDSYEIGTPGGMYAFMKLLGGGSSAFKDKTIKLTADIAMNEVKEGTVEKWASGEETPANQWIPAGNDTPITTHFVGTFDGQGHTISGLYVKSDKSHAGLFGTIGEGGTVKNLRLVDSYIYTSGKSDEKGYVKNYAYAGSIAGECDGTIENVYSNAIVASESPRVGGIVGVSNMRKDAKLPAVIKKAWFDGEVRMTTNDSIQGGGIVGLHQQRKVMISDCLFTGTLKNEATAKGIFIGGIIGRENNNNADVTIEHCLSAGKVESAYTVGVGSLVGGIGNEKSTWTITESFATTECYQKDKSVGNINDKNTKYKGINTEIKTLEKANILGEAAKDILTGFDFDTTWSTREGDVPALKGLLPEKTAEDKADDVKTQGVKSIPQLISMFLADKLSALIKL